MLTNRLRVLRSGMENVAWKELTPHINNPALRQAGVQLNN